MSINACSINEHTINSICGSRRQAIIDWLRPEVGGAGSVQHVRPVNAPWQNFIRRPQEAFDETYESSHIQVSIEFNGSTSSQTLELSSIDKSMLVFVPKVSVTNMNDESVNITNLKVLKAE